MHFSVTFCLCFVVFGLVLTEEHKSSKREMIVSFYKCIACAEEDAHTAYAKCEDMKTEKTRQCSDECLKEVMGSDPNEDYWKQLCEKPEDIEKIVDCIAKKKEESPIKLTDEDKESWKKFKECAKDVNEQYCSGQ